MALVIVLTYLLTSGNDMDWLSFFAGAGFAIAATAFLFCLCCVLSARTLEAGVVEVERERHQSLDVRV